MDLTPLETWLDCAPGRPLWARLVGAKRGGNHLFLRYALTRTSGRADEE